MLKSIASKVMWVGRATIFMVGLVVILFLTLAIVAQAADARVPALKKGVANTVKTMTTLVGNIADPILKLDNDGTGPALSLEVGTDKPPLVVNADAGTAVGLSADKLDGEDSADFQQSNAAAGGDLSGNYPNPQITDNAVSGGFTGEIANNTVDQNDIATDAVRASEVGNGTLDIADLADKVSALTIDMPAVDPSSCGGTVVGLNGADSGDYVIVSPPENLPMGLVVFTTNPEEDGVNIRVCNITAGEGASVLDPPSATWRMAVFDDGDG